MDKAAAVSWCVSRDRGDTYYCMLFNDEVHTYEQVIYTLQKAVNCSQKEAVSFATTVDRDVSAPPPHSHHHTHSHNPTTLVCITPWVRVCLRVCVSVCHCRAGSRSDTETSSSVTRPSLSLW